jgi:bifunctional ADP-heptose synthase (sugar kinase/adenylyltransferase)
MISSQRGAILRKPIPACEQTKEVFDCAGAGGRVQSAIHNDNGNGEDRMFRRCRAVSLTGTMVLLAGLTTASAAEIKVLNANALTIAMKKLAADSSRTRAIR